MRAVIYLFFIVLASTLFSTLTASHKSEDDLFCEPSVIFPELFFIREAECFSHSVANEIYENNSLIEKYLGRFASNQHADGYRYYYYLKEKNFLAAVTTIIHMVNKGSLPSSIDDPFVELNNSIIQGVRKVNEQEKANVNQPFTGSAMSPKTVEELESDFFSLMTYVASYVSERMGSSRDSSIIYRTYSILLSNIASGVKWEGDRFLHERFNILVSLKNDNLLEDYFSLFFFKSRGDDFNLPSFSSFMRLRDSGAVSFNERFYSNISGRSSFRNIIAGFFLDNLHKLPQIIVTETLPVKTTELERISCEYLKERGEWLKSLPAEMRREVLYYNEAVKIVEQCEGSLSFPFIIDENTIYILSDSMWMIDIALSLRYLAAEGLGRKDGDTVLRGAVRASLEKASGRDKRSMDEEFLIYSEKIGKSPEVLRAFFASYLPPDDEKTKVEKINEAAIFLSKILF